MKNAISPYCVGVDSGCGMIAVRTSLKRTALKGREKAIIGSVRRDVPMGFSRQPDDRMRDKAKELLKTYHGKSQEIITLEEVYSSLGTAGGGNHFLELQYEGLTDDVWVMIHSGSRHIGKTVCDKHQAIAASLHPELHKDLAYLAADSSAGKDYIDDMNFCLAFAEANRREMLAAVIRVLDREVGGCEALETVQIHHNYASLEEHFGEMVWVHRKGATCAEKGLLGIIPGSMGTHSYVTRGLGNPDSFNSCSHGAGRRMSRGQAKKRISMEEFRASMDGVASCDVDREHLDESPMAYKDISEVMSSQTDLTEVVHELSPLINMKG